MLGKHIADNYNKEVTYNQSPLRLRPLLATTMATTNHLQARFVRKQH
jgi:hypothetical protein